MKYVIFEGEQLYYIVVMPEVVSHCMVQLDGGEHEECKPIAAGFYYFDDLVDDEMGASSTDLPIMPKLAHELLKRIKLDSTMQFMKSNYEHIVEEEEEREC